MTRILRIELLIGLVILGYIVGLPFLLWGIKDARTISRRVWAAVGRRRSRWEHKMILGYLCAGWPAIPLALVVAPRPAAPRAASGAGRGARARPLLIRDAVGELPAVPEQEREARASTMTLGPPRPSWIVDSASATSPIRDDHDQDDAPAPLPHPSPLPPAAARSGPR